MNVLLIIITFTTVLGSVILIETIKEQTKTQKETIEKLNENYTKIIEVLKKPIKKELTSPKWKTVSINEKSLHFRKETNNKIAETIEIYCSNEEITCLYKPILKRDPCYTNRETYRIDRNKKNNIYRNGDGYEYFSPNYSEEIIDAIYKKILPIMNEIDNDEAFTKLANIEKILINWK